MPASFIDPQREASKIATESIRLEVIKIINEETAKTLA
jgi:molecular chaperone DnaK (HSP70)